MNLIGQWRLAVVSAAGVVLAAAANAEEPTVTESARWATVHHVARSIPEPSPRHDGNVFLQGDEVVIPIPEDVGEAHHWRVLDDTLAEIRRGAVDGRTDVSLGEVPIGWYRIEFLDSEGRCIAFTTAAVLARLAAPIPQDSPVCVDVALSWLGGEGRAEWEDFARLAALAGVNWVRDRIHWREVQTGPTEFISNTKYDAGAEIQMRHGLKVLQVFHTTPAWALDPASDPDRPRTDLRHLYAFCKAMAGRFRGRVQAWEPWNEGNAGNFGGRTIDEMCAHQKAAYLGFKAGDPGLTVCWNPIGGINTPAQAKGILANETWPYYDVYSIHSYDWPHAYESLWQHARAAACGRPIWVTECDRGMKADTASPCGDFTHEFALRKAELMAQSYARSLFSGATRHFHFILGYYMEGDNTVQFGLLRRDATPRPSYVALAALGRFLAGARCLGRWELEGQADAHVYAFRAQPDGRDRDVLVAWTEKQADWPGRGVHTLDWALPPGLAVEAVFDYLGRPLGADVPDPLKPAAVFIVMAAGEADKLPLRLVRLDAYREGTPSPVVLQFDAPGCPPVIRREAWTQEPERVFEPGSETDCVLVAYNLGGQPVAGGLSIEGQPKGWRFTPDRWDMHIEPFKRQQMKLRLTAPAQPVSDDSWITIRGAFGEAGRPVLAFRVSHPEPGDTR